MAIVPDQSVPSEPSAAFLTGKTLVFTFSNFQQFSDVQLNARLKLEYNIEGEDMRSDLALPSVVNAITGIEEISMDGEGVGVATLQTPAPVNVNGSESVCAGDQHVVRSKPYEGSWGTTRRYGSASKERSENWAAYFSPVLRPAFPVTFGHPLRVPPHQE